MLRLYGENNFRVCRDEGLRRWGEEGGQKTKVWVDLSEHERIWERSDDGRAHK